MLSPFVVSNPAVTSVTYNYSVSPHQLTVHFNESVAAGDWSQDLTVIDLNTGSAVPTSNTQAGWRTSWTFTLGSAYTDIAAANYAAILNSSDIVDQSANPLLGSDGVAGHNYLFTQDQWNTAPSPQADFFYINGDCTRNRSVGQDDLNVIAANYGKAGGYAQGDINYDGQVNFTDVTNCGAQQNATVPQLGAPGTPLAASVSSTSVQVSWAASSDSNVSSYDVYRDTQRIATGLTTTSYTDTGLSPYATHTYMVVSRDAAGDSSYPASLTVTTAVAGSAPVLAPIPPQTITEGETLNLSDTFTDTDTADRHTAQVKWGDGATSAASVTESNGSGSVSAAHPYPLTGAYTAILTVADNNGGSAALPISVSVRPLAPTAFTATTISSSQIDLAWTDNSHSETGYEVDRSLDGANWFADQLLPANTTTFSDTPLADGTQYSYRVAAVSGGVYSDYAGPASAATPYAAPTIVSGPSIDSTPVTGNSAVLSVLATAPRGEGYLTYQWTTTSQPPSAQPPTFSDNGSNTAQQTVVTFQAAGSYTFEVAVTNGGVSVGGFVVISVNQTPTAINVTPPGASVAQQQQQQFTANELDQFGTR